MLEVITIEGKEYYRRNDVLNYFAKRIYREDVLRGIKAVKDEIRMREQVFKNDRMRKEVKVAEMDNVLRILCRTVMDYPMLTKSMFGGETNGNEPSS